MNFLWNWMAGFRRHSRIVAITDRVVARSLPAVWQRVSVRGATMSLAESYGYIRARAASEILREVNIAAGADKTLRAVDRARIVQRATERVVRQTLADLRRAPRRRRLRRAA